MPASPTQVSPSSAPPWADPRDELRQIIASVGEMADNDRSTGCLSLPHNGRHRATAKSRNLSASELTMSGKETNLPKAARLARAAASDIAIYNEEKLRRGIENDRLFEELDDDIREGLRMWNEKVAPEIVEGTNLFQKAFVDIVFAQHGNTRSKIF